MIYGGLTGDSAAVNATARVVGGIAMLVIAVVVGALAIAPGVVRDVVRRKKSEE
jgi:high-affinity Fe2+/Pb2+ permease